MADTRRLYIDSCCFIDMVKTKIGKTLKTERENDVWYLKRLLEASRDKEIEVYTSAITIAECSHGGDGDISQSVKTTFSLLLMSGQYVRLVQTTPFIGADARDLRWRHGLGLKGADAIHVASAIDRKCEEFLTSDERLLRLSKHKAALSKLGIEVRAARETSCLSDKYRQLELDDEKEEFLMPAKKSTLTDAERAKRIRETARKAETSNDPKDFERAFETILKPPNPRTAQIDRKK